MTSPLPASRCRQTPAPPWLEVSATEPRSQLWPHVPPHRRSPPPLPLHLLVGASNFTGGHASPQCPHRTHQDSLPDDQWRRRSMRNNNRSWTTCLVAWKYRRSGFSVLYLQVHIPCSSVTISTTAPMECWYLLLKPWSMALTVPRLWSDGRWAGE